MAGESEGRCAGCRWFARTEYDGPVDEDLEEVEPERWGVCQFIRDSARKPWREDEVKLPRSGRAYPQDSSEYSAWLVVREDFGCVEWTEVET